MALILCKGHNCTRLAAPAALPRPCSSALPRARALYVTDRASVQQRTHPTPQLLVPRLPAQAAQLSFAKQIRNYVSASTLLSSPEFNQALKTKWDQLSSAQLRLAANFYSWESPKPQQIPQVVYESVLELDCDALGIVNGPHYNPHR
jgi:hypothetical protein